MKIKNKLASVVHQGIGDRKGNADSYESWLHNNARPHYAHDDGETLEPTQANPDSLPEGTSYFGDTQPTAPQLLMGEAIEHLQGRQKQVYLLMMREGMSCQQAGMKLGISKWTARDYKDRALRFITQYCKRHLEKHAND